MDYPRRGRTALHNLGAKKILLDLNLTARGFASEIFNIFEFTNFPSDGSFIQTVNSISTRADYADGIYGDKLFIFGGGYGVTTVEADGWVFDRGTKVWSPLDMTNGPSKRLRMAAVFMDQAWFVFGGSDYKTTNTDLYLYYP